MHGALALVRGGRHTPAWARCQNRGEASKPEVVIVGASVAGLMLTTNVLVTELKEDDEPVAGAVA